MNKSLLVENMQHEAKDMEEFPVLIGDEIAYFHAVEGGFDVTSHRHVVKFIHEVQGVGSPNNIYPDQASHSIEAHLKNNYYNLHASSVDVHGNYPEEDHIFIVRVKDHMRGPHSFSEELTSDTDRRETNHEM